MKRDNRATSKSLECPKKTAKKPDQHQPTAPMQTPRPGGQWRSCEEQGYEDQVNILNGDPHSYRTDGRNGKRRDKGDCVSCNFRTESRDAYVTTRNFRDDEG